MCDNQLTIYLTTYNRASYLKESILSIVNQTYKNYRLIILDNCSTDNTREVVAPFLTDERIQYIRHENNIGGLRNINYAFENCDTKFFCVFHDDDILHSDLLEKEIEYLEENPNCDAVSCLANNIDENGKITKISQTEKYIKTFEGNSFFKEYLYKQKHFIFPATIYRNSFIKKHGIMMNYNVGPCSDVVLYMDIERYGGRVAELNETLFDYRIYPNQDSSINLEKMLLQLISFLQNDDYYSPLMTSNQNGANRYFKWYTKILMARTAAGAVSADMGIEYIIEMKKLLNIPFLLFSFSKLILHIEKLMPNLFHAMYMKMKEVKS